MNKKVLLLNHTQCGGAERMVILYAKILMQAGFDCEMIFVQSKRFNDPTILKFLPENLPFKVIKPLHGRLVKYVLGIHLLRHPAEYVFASSTGFSVDLIKIQKLFNLKFKTIIRLPNMPAAHSNKLNALAKEYLPLCNSLIAQTQEMKEEMISYYGVTGEKVTVINNPIDKTLILERTKESYEMDRDYINYIAIGQVIPRKDILTLLKAFNEVLRQNHKCRLYILGKCSDATYKEILDQYIVGNNLSDFVFFEGFQTNPFKYLNSADIFVLSSIDEGLPNVMLEAIYLGKPVVCTKSVPYIEQTLSSGIYGFAVPVGDHIALAEGMIKAKTIKNENKYTDINHSEEKIVEIFSN